jgi:hypothetical protein
LDSAALIATVFCAVTTEKAVTRLGFRNHVFVIIYCLINFLINKL